MLLLFHNGLLVYGECVISGRDDTTPTDNNLGQGVPFTSMWLKFGVYGDDLDPEYVTEIANRASSIYFVTLVVM